MGTPGPGRPILTPGPDRLPSGWPLPEPLTPAGASGAPCSAPSTGQLWGRAGQAAHLTPEPGKLGKALQEAGVGGTGCHWLPTQAASSQPQLLTDSGAGPPVPRTQLSHWALRPLKRLHRVVSPPRCVRRQPCGSGGRALLRHRHQDGLSQALWFGILRPPLWEGCSDALPGRPAGENVHPVLGQRGGGRAPS